MVAAAIRRTTAAGAAALLLLTAGCGGMSKEEKKASASIAENFSGRDPSKARAAVGRCVGDTMVDKAGLDQLKKDKVVTAGLKASATIPQKLSKTTAEAYADGIVKCFDFTKLSSDLRKQTGATKAQVDAYAACLDKIDDADLHQAIVDQFTRAKPTKASTRVNKATQACGKKLGT